MSHEGFTRLLESFGRTVGVEGLQLDDNGYCALSFDDIIVHFQSEDRLATIFSRIATIDEGRIEGISAMLLAANIFWQGTKGATLSVEPDTRMVFAADQRHVDLFDDKTFAAWLQDFVNISEYWAGRMQAANAGGALFMSPTEQVSTEKIEDTEFMTRV